MHAIDLIHRPGVAVAADATVAEAADHMERLGVGCLAVTDGHSLVGIVTDRDLVRRVIARRMGFDVRIDSVMSSPVVAVQADADARSVFDMFRTHAVRRIAVMRADEFVGIVTVDDLLVFLANQLADVARPVTAEVLFAQHDPGVPAPIGSVG